MPPDYPDFTTAPTAEDVQITLQSAGFWPTDAAKQNLAQSQAEAAVQAAYNEFELATGYAPFLASATPVTVPYFVDVSNWGRKGVIQLDNGLLELSSLTWNGASVSGTDVIAQPSIAPIKGRPYTWLQIHNYGLWRGWAHQPVRVEVTGIWGYSASMPPAAWFAILRLAAVQVLGQIENLQSIASISQDGFSKAFDIVGIITPKDLLNELTRRYNDQIALYRRVVA